MLYRLPLAALALACAAAPAAAATVDLSGFATYAVNFAAAVATGIALVILYFIANYVRSKIDLTKTEIDEVILANVEVILNRAISYAKGQAMKKVGPGGSLSKVEVDNWFISQALQYVLKSMPGYIAKLGLSETRIIEMITARLDQHFPGMVPTLDAVKNPKAPSQ